MSQKTYSKFSFDEVTTDVYMGWERPPKPINDTEQTIFASGSVLMGKWPLNGHGMDGMGWTSERTSSGPIDWIPGTCGSDKHLCCGDNEFFFSSLFVVVFIVVVVDCLL